MSEEVKVESGTEVVIEAFAENSDEKLMEKTEELKSDRLLIIQIVGWLISRIGFVTILLTIMGFFTIHSYIATFSTLFLHNISVGQYIGAGLSFFVTVFMLILGICIQYFRWILLFIFIIFLMIVFPYIFKLYNLKREITRKDITEKLVDSIENVLSPIDYILDKLEKPHLILSIITVILFAFMYGTNVYKFIPHMFGGGQPANIILVFNDEQQSDLWGFEINPENPRLSQPLQMLIELNDGIIVRQSYNYPAVIVKNSVLQGFRDASRPIPFPSPEPTASPTPSS